MLVSSALGGSAAAESHGAQQKGTGGEEGDKGLVPSRALAPHH